MQQYDVVVVGGGMVGAATAVGLAQQGKSVLLLERQAPKPFDETQAIDLRVSALSLGTIRLLEQLQAWPAIELMRRCPYQTLQVWDDPKQKLSFKAEQLNVPYLGHIVENRIVQLALWQAAEALGVSLTIDASPKLLSNDASGVRLALAGKTVAARLLVVADGAESPMRDQLGIGISAWDYRQRCFAINVKLEAPQQVTTWQQFFPSGPRALLPLPEQHAALVWYDQTATIQRLQQLNTAQLKQAIIEAFPPLPGDFEILEQASFGLRRRHAQHYHKQSAIVIGDAAHTINPLAGQGVNLGFRDVNALLSAVLENQWSTDLGACLTRVERQRKPDNLLMQTAMDACYLGFSNDKPLLKKIRSLALGFANNSGAIKNRALKYALGIN